ncbi:MAG: D-alanyl-D-alanine carboxypeptidase family protein [Angustibacter sp.]
MGARGRRAVGALAVVAALVTSTWALAGPASAGTTADPSATSSASPSADPSADATASPTASSTDTPTGTATATGTPTDTPTGTATATSAPPTTAGPAASSPGRPATTGPAPTARTTPLPARPVDADGPLTPEEVRAQLAQAAALAAERRAVNAGLQAAAEQLQALGRQMAAALDELSQARDAQAAAEHVRVVNAALLTQVAGELSVQRDALGQWARETYAVGGPMAAYEGWLVALEGHSTADVAHSLSVLQQVGVAGSAAVIRLQTAVATQQQAAQQASLAAAQAAAARVKAEAAVKRLRSLQQQARVVTARLQLQQAHLMGEAALTAAQQARLKAAEAIVAAAGPLSAGADCRGLDTSGFANGMVPAAALCPVWGAPGHLLRADAAEAFRRLSRQYATEFGRPICVTDSYRSLAAQVKVYAEKPQLAARPGTSNHGRGVAVDLCGGIQSFGTAEHAWMVAHAPLSGWFLPGWAGPDGSKPEPWHWEFAG